MLHIRWWHAPAARMARILRSAGAPEAATSQLDTIVDTCRPCCTWERPSPVSTARPRVTEHFNEVVQHDLMFVSPQPGKAAHTKDDPRAVPRQHIRDTAVRMSQGSILTGTTSAELI